MKEGESPPLFLLEFVPRFPLRLGGRNCLFRIREKVEEFLILLFRHLAHRSRPIRRRLRRITNKGYVEVAEVEKPIVTRDPNRPTLKINLGIYVRNNGDGSGSVSFFRNSEDAEKAAEGDDERYCDDTYDHTIEVYADTGELVMDDAEREAASDKAWDKRSKLEAAMKKEKNPAKKAKLKQDFETADKEWSDLH